MKKRDAMIGFLLRIDLCVCIVLMENLVEVPLKDSKKEVSSLTFWINFPNKLPNNNLKIMLAMLIVMMPALLYALLALRGRILVYIWL